MTKIGEGKKKKIKKNIVLISNIFKNFNFENVNQILPDNIYVQIGYPDVKKHFSLFKMNMTYQLY